MPTGPGPGNDAEHASEVSAGEGEHAGRDGCLAGQDQQDVRHARQVPGRQSSLPAKLSF